MSKDTSGARLVLPEVRGPLFDLIEKLGGVDGIYWLHCLKKFLRKENPWVMPKVALGMEVGVGMYSDPTSLLKSFEHRCIDLSLDEGFFEKIELSSSKKTVKLFVTSVKELGFPKGARFSEVSSVARSIGLRTCPVEVAFYLCLNHGMSMYKHILFPNGGIENDFGNPSGSVLIGRDGSDKMYISSHYVGSETFCESYNLIAFSSGSGQRF